jgi:peptide/nickel transport system permease protein
VRYVRQKLIQLVVVVLSVTILTFLLMSALPGDRAVAIGGVVGGENADQYYDGIREQWGLDEPLPVQYLIWLQNAVTGDLGVSSSFNTPVTELIKNRLPVSLWLMFYTLLFSMLISIPLGVFMAYRANRPADRVANTVLFGLLSVPNYIMGVLLIFLFSIRLGWFPALSDYVPLWEDPVEHWQSMFLPVLTLTLGQLAVYSRLLRSDMIGTLQNDFITLARSKGVPNSKILFGHALRPSTFSLITAAAVNVGALIGGSVIVEQIFGLPGMGQLVVEAIYRRDFLVVQTCVVIFAITFVVVNFLVDLLYAFIDPRIRHARALA